MNRLIALIVTASLALPALSFAGEGANAGGSATEATTVKGSKSNTSERSGGNTDGNAAEASTVKSSKSNSSERSGNSAGGTAVEGTTVRSGKSNSDN